MPQVYIIDSDVDFNWTTTRLLNSHGYRTFSFRDGNEAIQSLRETPPDLVLTEVVLPSMSGQRLCRYLRGRTEHAAVPVMFLTAFDDIDNKITAYTAGCDDYLVKPFDTRELLLRINAVLRRNGLDARHHVVAEAPKSQLEIGDIRLDLETATVHSVHGEYLLTPTELNLLRLLMENAGQVMSGKRLMAELWGKHGKALDDTAAVRWHVKNLRLKIEPDPANPTVLRTLGHHGYLLVRAPALQAARVGR